MEHTKGERFAVGGDDKELIEVSPGLFTGKKGAEEFRQAVLEEVENSKQDTVSKLNNLSSKIASRWPDFRYYIDNQEWLSLADAIASKILEQHGMDAKNYVRRQLACDEGMAGKILSGDADLRLSEITSLLDFDDFLETLTEYNKNRIL